MNILSITGILPIKDLVPTNDFLIPLYSTYKKKYPEDNVYFIRLEKLRPFTKLGRSLSKIKTFELGGHTISLMRYFSIWRLPNLHCLISSYSAYFLNRRKLLHFIKQHKIDVIHAEYIIPDGYLAYLISKKSKIPYIVTTHYESRYFNSFVSRTAVLKVLKNAKFVTPLNHVSKDLYRKNNIDQILIVPHGIDHSFLNAQQKPHNTKAVRIISVGSLIKMKNLGVVLLALSNLKNKYLFHYTIVGAGPEKDYLVTLARNLDIEKYVDFTGNIPYSQVLEELTASDIFVLPSYFETFGRVLFEAMAVGLPVICSKNTGIHGYFKEGEEGLSVIHNDVADIESKLSVLLDNENLRREMGQKAKLAMMNYTWDKIVVTFHDLYKKTLMLD